MDCGIQYGFLFVAALAREFDFRRNLLDGHVSQELVAFVREVAELGGGFVSLSPNCATFVYL